MSKRIFYTAAASVIVMAPALLAVHVCGGGMTAKLVAFAACLACAWAASVAGLANMAWEAVRKPQE